MSDVTTVAKDVLESSQCQSEKEVYMSLPRPGVSTYKFILFLVSDFVKSKNYSSTVSMKYTFESYIYKAFCSKYKSILLF